MRNYTSRRSVADPHEVQPQLVNQTQELADANRQLLCYAKDLRRVYHAERSKSRLLEQAYRDSVMRLISVGHLRDEETGAHMRRIGEYSKHLCQELSLPSDEVDRVHWAAPLHDIGKMGIPESVLLKQGELTEQEWELVKSHPTLGAEMLSDSSSPYLQTASQIALHHHERWDGSGYPQGLSGSSIPLSGRIVMLADRYDALRSERPYKSALSHNESCKVILQGDGNSMPEHFDARLLEIFVMTHAEFDRIYESSRHTRPASIINAETKRGGYYEVDSHC